MIGPLRPLTCALCGIKFSGNDNQYRRERKGCKVYCGQTCSRAVWGKGGKIIKARRTRRV